MVNVCRMKIADLSETTRSVESRNSFGPVLGANGQTAFTNLFDCFALLYLTHHCIIPRRALRQTLLHAPSTVYAIQQTLF